MHKFGVNHISDDLYRFAVWAPGLPQVSVVLHGEKRAVLPMQRTCGFHIAEIHAKPGSQYMFRLPDGRELPDPASRFQPDGVHGVSAVVDTCAFEWNDENFAGHSMPEMVIYELHLGTFTQEGTCKAAISRLDQLVELGITAIEIMPVAQFPGSRNWGYDGVHPFAVQNTYGGPNGLQQLVNAAHERGLSVILDVVYNHLGPEGNYFGAYAPPFFTDRYHTPWGQAINYDEAYSDAVREFFIQNALYWLEEFHIDALRLDAVHGIFDFSAHHILAELEERVRGLGAHTKRPLHLIAESDLNDARLLHCERHGGYGLAAQWSDDFHHSLHTLLTKETAGYYGDFGSLEDLADAMQSGWVYSGQYSKFRRRRHGNSPQGLSPERFVVCIQNHDQVGNRVGGERLSQLVDFERLKLAAGVVLLSPFVPLLFMGEEYGETRPFQYFTSHLDAALIEAVRKGRRDEFAAFGWAGHVPDPQENATFVRSRPDFSLADAEPHRTLRKLYKTLMSTRKRLGITGVKPEVECDPDRKTLTLTYGKPSEPASVVFYFGGEHALLPMPKGGRTGQIAIHSAERIWLGQQSIQIQSGEGSFPAGPYSFVLFESKSAGAKT